MALLCIDQDINPKDLRTNELLALNETEQFIRNKELAEKKKFRFLDSEINENFEKIKNTPEIQSDLLTVRNKLHNNDLQEMDFVSNYDDISYEEDMDFTL